MNNFEFGERMKVVALKKNLIEDEITFDLNKYKNFIVVGETHDGKGEIVSKSKTPDESVNLIIWLIKTIIIKGLA